MFLALISGAVVWAWIVAHQIVIYYVVAVLIEQLPEPTDKSSAFYKYFYSVVQLLAANWKRTGITAKK